MLRKTEITALLVLVCCAFGMVAAQTTRQTLNIVLNPEFQLEAPLTVKKPSDPVRVDWVEVQSVGSPAPESVHIFYSRTPNGGDTSKYTRINVRDDSASDRVGIGNRGYIRFIPEKNNIGAGTYYCIVAYTSGGVTYYSNYFNLMVTSLSPPLLKNPKGLVGSAATIDELTPTFSWDAVDGVPYYHIILSDEPLPVADLMESEGGVVNLDLSIVWQAITPNNRITYGAPDPSNTITASPPPLSPGKEYSWLVLNNYGNHMIFTDGNAFDIPGVFRIRGDTLRAPEVVSPKEGVEISGDVVRFTWRNLDTAANSYLINLFAATSAEDLGVGELGELDASFSASMLVWETTVSRGGKGPGDNLSVDLTNAKGTLTGGKYIWRVYALDSRGAASTGVLSKGEFHYNGVLPGTVILKTVEKVGDADVPIGYVELRSEVISGPMQAPLAFYTGTDGTTAIWDNGTEVGRDFPEGTYRVTAVKEGFNTETVTFTVTANQRLERTIYMKRPDAVVYGRVAGPDSAWINLAKVTAVSEWGDTVTALTDGSGNFTLSCKAADWTITVEKAGYGVPRPKTVTLRQGDNTNPWSAENPLGAIYLTRNPNTLSGTVRNAGGTPVIGAKVRVLREGVLIEELASTPQNGAYSFSLPSGTYTLTAEKPSFAMYSRNIDLTGSRNQDITIAENAALINGAVIGKSWNASKGDFEHAPIPNAKVTFISVVTPPARPDTFTVTSDATFGKFSLSVPGGKTFDVRSEAGGFVSRAAPRVTTTGGETMTYNDTLQALAMIKGRVLGGGNGLADVDVIVYDSSANRVAASAKSSGDGSFEIRNIPDGEYIINAGKNGHYLLNAGVLNNGLVISGGKPEPSSVSYTLTMGVGEKTITWTVIGDNTRGSIKVTSPLNRTIPFNNTAGDALQRASLDSVGSGDYVIEAVAESNPQLLQLSYHKFKVSETDTVYSDTVSFPLRRTPKDTVVLNSSGIDTLEVGLFGALPSSSSITKLTLFYKSEGSTRYDSTEAPSGIYKIPVRPVRDGCDLQYYFRVELSNSKGDTYIYGSPKQIFTSYVKPSNTTISRITVDPGSSGDTLYLPSNYTVSFAFKAFYSDLFIPFGETVNFGSVAWSISGTGASRSGSELTTGAQKSENLVLSAVFTPVSPYTLKNGKTRDTVAIPIKVTGSALKSVTVVRNGGSGPISNTENASFRVEASDDSGRSVTVSPEWRITPETAVMRRMGGDGTFAPRPDFFGVAHVYASVGGMVAEYREDGADLPGLSVYHVIRNKAVSDTALTYTASRLRFAFAANGISAGESAELRAVIRSTNSDMKNTIYKGSGFRMADTLAYDVEFLRKDRIDSTVSIIIDIPAHLKSEAAKSPNNFKIARWSDSLVNWVELPSSEVISGGAAVIAKLHRDASDIPVVSGSRKSKASKMSKKSGAAAEQPVGASKLYASARYAVVANSAAFSLSLTVSPNPFSPYIRPIKEYGKNVSRSEVPAGTCFRVNVEAEEGFVQNIEVSVYNATGKRVWAVEKLGAEVGETRIWWDGRTTSRKEMWNENFLEQNKGRGRMCRNGRYFVHVVVTDMAGEKKRAMKPLVMMK